MRPATRNPGPGRRTAGADSFVPRDTIDALTGAQKTAEPLATQQARVAALREYARLSRPKFESGAGSRGYAIPGDKRRPPGWFARQTGRRCP